MLYVGIVNCRLQVTVSPWLHVLKEPKPLLMQTLDVNTMLKITFKPMVSIFVKVWVVSVMGKQWARFRTGPYFIMHTLLCFKKTIAITIDVLWDCGSLFFFFRGFFSKSTWT